MKKKECPSCAMGVDAKSSTCPVCGYEFTHQPRTLQWAALLLVVLFLLYLIF